VIETFLGLHTDDEWTLETLHRLFDGNDVRALDIMAQTYINTDYDFDRIPNELDTCPRKAPNYDANNDGCEDFGTPLLTNAFQVTSTIPVMDTPYADDLFYGLFTAYRLIASGRIDFALACQAIDADGNTISIEALNPQVASWGDCYAASLAIMPDTP